MIPANQELNLPATEEELRSKARAVLAGSRPRFVPGLLSWAGIMLTMHLLSGSGLPLAVKMCIITATVGMPILLFEVWYLTRRLEAALILQGLSRHQL